MTHWRTSLLISVPILLGAAACGWAGVWRSVPGSIAASAVLVAYVGLACVWVNRPLAALADLAQRLTEASGSGVPGGVGGSTRAGSDRQRLVQSFQSARDRIDADSARIAELETQLAAARSAAARADDAKRAFLQSVGHELRTPLNAVIGMTHLSMQTSLSPQQRDYLERSNRSAHSLLRQIESILDYVRLEAGDLHIGHSAFNLQDVIEGVADTVMHAAGDKPLTVRLERDPNIPSALAGDAQRLGQVLTTLADNIVKTADAGEIIIGAHLVAIDSGRAQVAFKVGCTGHEIQRRSVKAPCPSPQGRPHAAHTDAIVSRGTSADLGIGVSHRLVAALGGRLEVERKAPYGNIRCRFTLPLALGARQPSCDVSSTTRGQPAVTAPMPDTKRPGHADRTCQRPQMNLDGIRERLHRNSHLLHRLLLRFRADHAHFVDDYAILFRTHDRRGASQLARALESAAASLGAVQLKESAARLATKRRSGDDPSIELDRVRELLERLFAEIDDELAGTDSATMPQRSPCDASAAAVDNQIAQTLQALSELLAGFDAAAINRFEDLRPSLRGLVAPEHIEDLQRAIHGFDFTLAQHRLTRVATGLCIQLRATT
jgi:nitrogen-specific signal transduction histidine kinase/HPt (histidine-containing phosphotransfer) domain-containing protein